MFSRGLSSQLSDSVMIMRRRPTSPWTRSPPADGVMKTYLPHWFEPSDRDVICGWAKQNHLHAGNQRFRQLVEVTAPLYDAAQTKQEKTKVIASLVRRIRRESQHGGGFIKRDTITGLWYEIGDDKARDKVGHAIRRVVDDKKKKKRNFTSLSSKLVSSSDKSANMATEFVGPSLSIRAASMPMKMDLLGTHIVASLPQRRHQNRLGNNAAAPSPGLSHLPGSLPINTSLRNDVAQNMNNTSTTQSIPSNSYIGGSDGRIGDTPHLRGLGNLSGGNSMHNGALQLRRQSLRETSDFGSLFRLLSQPPASMQDQLRGLPGSTPDQDQMLQNPFDMTNLLTSQLSGTGTSFLPTNDMTMDQLLSTLYPTPIGPTNATTKNYDQDYTAKKKESSRLL